MKPKLYPLKTKTLPDLKEVGGKAQSLIAMTQKQFPVPGGFVLSVAFFEPWLKKIQETTEWGKFLKSSRKDLKKHCDAIKKKANSLKMTKGQKENLKSALKPFKKGTLFAVRSSSPEEDLEGTSFAGGYETTLGVTPEKLEKAILKSFISVFDERIVKYKQQHGMAIDQPKIAIIVQEQVASEVSGVAFSLNPQNNCYDEAVINSNFGLGETIVSGQVTPDTFIVDKPKRKILEKKIAHKDHALWLTKTGGTEKKDNPNPTKSSLTNTQAKEVAKLVEKVEQYFGKPMDIEWAYAKKKLYLLQARPITAYLPLPPDIITKPGQQKYIYADALLAEQGFTTPSSMLGSDLYDQMAVIVLKEQFKMDLGGKGALMVNANGKYYSNLSNLIKVFGKGAFDKMLGQFDKPTGNILDHLDWEQYTPKEKPKHLKYAALKALPAIFGMGKAAMDGVFRPEKSLKEYQKQIKKDIESMDKLRTKQGSFKQIYDESFQILTEHMSSFYAVLLGPVIARYRLGKIFKKDDVKDLMVKLEMDLPGNPTSEMGHKMYELAETKEIQTCPDGKTFIKKLKSGDFSKSFIKKYEAFMKQFGFRCIREIDPATPRPYEDPATFFNHLKNMRVSDKKGQDRFAEVKKKQRAAYRELSQKAKKLGKQKGFEKYAKIIRLSGGYREVAKYIMVMAVDIIRQRALLVADKLIKQGDLDHRDQIFDLRMHDIERAEADPTLDLRSLAKENTKYIKKVAHIKDWPRIVDSRGKIYRPQRQRSIADGFVGDPISPGVIRGRAKVLNTPYEKPVEKGEILVTRATDPGWTPLFLNAAGVVLEVGGSLQHGAVIAREYGIPCVSGIEGAATMIKDGQLIEVDGDQGTIRVLDEKNLYMSKQADWTPEDPKAILVRSSIIELMPDPLTPLFQTVATKPITQGLDQLVKKLLKSDLFKTMHFKFSVLNGYGYYSMQIKLWSYLKMMPSFFRLLPWMFKESIKEWQENRVPKFREFIDTWKQKDIQKMTSQELLEGGQKLTAETMKFYTIVQANLPLIYMGEATFIKYYDKFVKKKGDPPSQTFMLGYDSLPILADKSLYDLAKWTKKDKMLASFIKRHSDDEIKAWLDKKNKPNNVDKKTWNELKQAFHSHLERYGHMIYDLDVGKAVAFDSPEPLIETLKFYISGKGENPYKRQEKLIKEREEATEKIQKRLGKIKRATFNKLLKFAQRRAPLRENGLADVGLAYPTARKMFLELGQRMVKKKLIDQKEDIFWLELKALKKITKQLDARKKTADVKTTIEERKTLWHWQWSLTPPPYLPKDAKMMGYKLSWYFPGQANQGEVKTIKGLGASKGVVTGTARVIHGPEDFDLMQPGDILVTAITTPAWTPLFVLASGIVTDVGGPLSHSSIVAREYGVPAVLGTEVGSRQIKSGQRITVDGDRGEVKLT